MNRQQSSRISAIFAAAAAIVATTLVGCQSIRLPQIDPTGSRIFLPRPYQTTPLWPGHRHSSAPTAPAFTHPTQTPANNLGSGQTARPLHLAGHRLDDFRNSPGRTGEIILTPSRIIAPVGSEVVVMAGICGGDGYYVINQPLEWMMSPDSVGQMVEVGGMEHSQFNNLVPPSSKKFDGQYAWGRTALKEKLITRGTPTPVDDIQQAKGQHYVTLSSPSEGISYITCVAPKAEAWDRRRATTQVYWVDALWSIPVPSTTTAGQPFTLNTLITRATDGSGVSDWKVKYEVVGGAPAEFLPTGAPSVVVTTTEQGTAPIQIRQPENQTTPGTTQLKVDVIRPGFSGGRDIVLESAITSITWSSPALSIRAIGPQSAGLDQPFNYRLEISNPGDQTARNVVLRTKNLPPEVQYISSEPKPAQYGDQYLWNLGDLNPGQAASIVNIQLKSSTQGQREICFEVSSDNDQIRTEACGTTLIAVPCLGLDLKGPTTGQVGGTAVFNIEVANQCTQPLTNVKLQVMYDEGLRATGLGNPIEAEIGTLLPSQRQTIPVQFDILTAGTRCFSLTVVSDGGHTAASRRCLETTQVSSPNLRVNVTSEPATVRVGEPVLTRVTVANTGTVPLDNVSILNQFSRSLSVRRATGPNDNLSRNFIGNDFAFRIFRLEPGSQQVLEIEFDTLQEDGDAFNRAVVTTPLGVNTTETARIRIEPAAAVPRGDRIDIPQGARRGDGLSVDVSTLTNPIRRNQEVTAFEVGVSNSSNQPLENVKITLLVPPGLRLSNVDSTQSQLPIAGRSTDGTQVFLQPRRFLRPGEQIRFTVQVIGEIAGQPVLEAIAESDGGASSRDSNTVTVVN